MVNPTISYYEKWLGGDGCLVMPGVQFIQSAERDKVQPGYPIAFDLYLWHDNERFGGSGQVNRGFMRTATGGFHNQPSHVEITIPPFGISILRPVGTVKKNNLQGVLKR